MSVKQSIEKIIHTPMSRREFLWNIGTLALAMVGVTSLVKALEQHQSGRAGGGKADSGYGSSAYGGPSARG